MSKGGSTTSTVAIPEYIEAAAQRNLNKAERVSQLGPVPEYGPVVAGFTPVQEAAMRNVASAAGAFGLDTTAGQGTYGMPAPTTFAGGIRGYSSAPLFEQSVEELARRRPAQKSYIDSFFIDPYTGQYGLNVAPMPDFPTRSEITQDRRGGGSDDEPNMREFMEEARANARMNERQPSGVPFTNDYPNMSSMPSIAGYTTPAQTMVTAREDNFGSDLSRSLSDPNYDPPGNVITRALGITKVSDNNNDGRDDSGGGDDGTVMCTAYCEMGYLPKEIWHLDRRYGVKVYRNDPALIEGYHTWGVPLANYIRKQTLGAKVLRAAMWPIVKAWAEEMAHNMKPEEYKPNYFGKLIKFVGEPFSRMCGKLKPRKIEGVA